MVDTIHKYLSFSTVLFFILIGLGGGPLKIIFKHLRASDLVYLAKTMLQKHNNKNY